jgi:hypothetical protein
MNTCKWFVRRFILQSFVLRYVLLYPIFWIGYSIFRRTGHTPWLAFISFLGLYGQTRGELNRRLSRAIARRSRLPAFREPCGVLGAGPELEIELTKAVETLRSDGYYVFQAKLPFSICEDLRTFARNHPATPRPAPPGHQVPLLFDPDNPIAHGYEFEEAELLALPAIQRLLADHTLLCLAQRYLGAPPINDAIDLWWSGSVGGRCAKEIGQYWHFDIDRIHFLKIFIYLTDVETSTGPHICIPGTHNQRPGRFYEYRKYSDEEIGASFPPDAIREIVGPAGTIFVGDPLCLHKGKVLSSGYRLALQLEFTNSLFGVPYDRPALPTVVDPELRRAMDESPTTFQRFDTLPNGQVSHSWSG